ncbi:hypothetical protein BBO99_00002496 [Phytophthora kernoviae]|uniref:Chromodomain-helicase-DNA-binding protein 1-like n=1 Tax=Phytophthora kernoviae TaxID=325452 RepID=A0A421GX10_9STRA|nr:hypothetical protein BBO99_00002496 [Phytophthora kernoviae]
MEKVVASLELRLQWLLRKYEQDLNPILGDEMGLGKTLQIIALIAALVTAERGQKKTKEGRYLIVAPLSVLPNWMEQFEQFAPGIRTVMYTTQPKERAATQRAVIAAPMDQPLVLVVSYEMLYFNCDFFQKIVWELLILDEGHRLKNPKGRQYDVVSNNIRANHKIILSGTPIQNDLQELFALLSILNPSVFDDQKLFENTFRDYFSAKAQRLDEQQQTKSKRVQKVEALMSRLLAPLLLLRTVQDVQDAFTLSPLSEMVVHTPMSPMQRAYYKEVIAKNAGIFSNAKSQDKVSLLNILPHLRKACNHPYLFPGAEEEPFVEGSHFQSTAFLDIIQDFLTLESFAYERIDGSVRGKERWQAIERFRKDPDTFVFLISTRAGGVGLNLQRADTVIFADSDYNPQADLQAVARAYRLGQTKPIHVIKFLCANTVEESIYRRALKKMRMADRIRNLARRYDEDNKEEEGDGDNLMDMIQFGLHRLMEETAGEDESTLLKPLDEEYIQHILARKTIDSVQENAGHKDEAVSTLRNDKLLESGGDFREENMYYFEGEDYSNIVDAKEKDTKSFLKLCREARSSTKRRTKAALGRYELSDEDEGDKEEDEAQNAENEAERVRKREERRQRTLELKLAKWKANNYESAVIDIDNTGGITAGPSPLNADGADPSRYSGQLYYKAGDASHPPLNTLHSSAYITVHCVDTSGVWSSRGFFRTLSALSPTIQKKYEAAGQNEDLKLGSAHLIQLPQQITPGSDAPIAAYVCLLVVQGFSGKKKQRLANGTMQLVRDGKSSTFRLNALGTALQALAQKALELDASVHLPRIGYGTPNFNWYAVERLLARNLRDAGVEASIYYYSARRRP